MGPSIMTRADKNRGFWLALNNHNAKYWKIYYFAIGIMLVQYRKSISYRLSISSRTFMLPKHSHDRIKPKVFVRGCGATGLGRWDALLELIAFIELLIREWLRLPWMAFVLLVSLFLGENFEKCNFNFSNLETPNQMYWSHCVSNVYACALSIICRRIDNWAV